MNHTLIEDEVTIEKTCVECHQTYLASNKKMMGRFLVPMKQFKASDGLCDTCSDLKQIADNQRYDRRKLNTHLGFNNDLIKAHFIANPPKEGDKLIVVDTGHNVLTYTLVTVTVPQDGKQKRIIVDSYTNGYARDTWYRTGKNAHAPTGQALLIIYENPAHSGVPLLIEFYKRSYSARQG